MVDTGGSLCHAAKALVELGHAKSVTACASHGVLSGPAIQRLRSCTNSLRPSCTAQIADGCVEKS